MRLVDTDEARNWTKQNDNTLAFPIGRATTITITSLPLEGRGEEEKRNPIVVPKPNQIKVRSCLPHRTRASQKRRGGTRRDTLTIPTRPDSALCSPVSFPVPPRLERFSSFPDRPQGAVWLRSPEADRRLPIPGHRPSNRSPVQPAIS